MIKMLKYHGYEDDGVEGYECLNCHYRISMRHHAFSSQINYCPFCGCKFEGGFIKDNKYKFYRKNEDGYFMSQLYKVKEFRYMWTIEKKSITHWGSDVIGEDKWETYVHTYNFSYDTNKSGRENILLQLRQDIKNEKAEKNIFGDKEVIEYRLKYCKYSRDITAKDKEENIRYYYPKNNKVILTNKKLREELHR